MTTPSPRSLLSLATTGLLAASLLAAGCGKGKDDAPAGAKPGKPGEGAGTGTAGAAATGPGADKGGKKLAQAPARGPERPVYSLIDNRLSAHLERNGGLLVAGGSSGMAKYVRFGNTEKLKQKTWEVRTTEGDVKVARLTGTSGRVDVPLTAAMLANPVVRVRAYSPDARAFAVRVNENADINAQLQPGWSVVEFPVPAGQLREGENQLQFFVRGSGLAVEWIQVGGTAPGDGATTFFDADAKRLSIPDGGAMTWYAFVPDKGLLAGDLDDPACEVAVTAATDDGATASGTLVGLGSAVDLSALAGKPARVTLTARGCPQARLAGAQLVVPGAPPAPPARGEPPKYVVMIVMDSLRADRLKVINPDARPTIPTFEKLLETGAMFTQHYVQGNESRVSHASLWSAMYPVKHSMIGAKEKLDLRFTTIDEVAKAAGMYVAGVSGNGYVEPARWGFGEKWDKYSNHIHEALGLKGADIMEKGLSFVSGRKEPWFLYMGFIDTHVSWRAKEPWIDDYSPGYAGRFAQTFSGQDAADVASGKLKLTDKEIAHVRALYDSNVSYQDELLRQLVEKFQAEGTWDQTMLIITADHGDEQWEDGRVGHGASVRDMLVHVPLFIHYPPLVPGGRVVEGAEVVDVVPTLADALGVPHDPEWQGESLLPLLAGAGRGYPRMSFNSMYEDTHGARIADWKVRVSGGSTPRVYDLGADPAESKDLWGTPASRIGGRAVLDPLWVFRSYNKEWKKSQWGNAANVSGRFATDLGE